MSHGENTWMMSLNIGLLNQLYLAPSGFFSNWSSFLIIERRLPNVAFRVYIFPHNFLNEQFGL